MPDELTPQTPSPQPLNYGKQAPDLLARGQIFLKDYAWFIARNVIGWLLMLLALPIGFALPGPFGFPIFLIGFALVTFPGKRKLTARVLRGIRLRLEDRAYAIIAGFISIAIPGIAWWIIWARYEETIRRLIARYTPQKIVFVLTPLLAILLTWLMTRLSLKILNGLLKLLPRFRRKFRPWLERWGLKLLPPRRRHAPQQPVQRDEILEFSPQQQRRMRSLWKNSQPWIRRIAAVGVTVWIVEIMIRPLRDHWPQVREQIAALNVWRFLAASALFAVFLLCFRALAWRRVLKGFGYKLPYGASVRIWATSELARYLPGAIWQVVGRVYLAKPYGVPGSIISTSQILEVCIFLFANVLVAGSCLLWFGQKMDPHARSWFITALVLVPTLALLLHPRIFYGAANSILKRLGKPQIVQRLRGRKLVQLLFWMVAGLVLQSVCVYLIADPVLHFKKDWWWVIAGAYCLAWCAGFLAFWAPGGIGVRELVFVYTMLATLPHQVREYFHDPATLKGILVLLGFLLRLWTVIGELILTVVAYIWDFRGWFNGPGGRAGDSIAEAESPKRPPASMSRGGSAAPS